MFIQMSRVWMITDAALLIALAANGNAQIVFNNLSAMDTFAPAGGVGIVAFAHGSGSGRHSSRNRWVASALNEAGLATLLLDLLTIDEERTT